jgi:hypothetical protein
MISYLVEPRNASKDPTECSYRSFNLFRRPKALLHADEIVGLADLGSHLNVQLLAVVDVERLDHAGANCEDLMRFQAAVVDQQDFIRNPGASVSIPPRRRSGVPI